MTDSGAIFTITTTVDYAYSGQRMGILSYIGKLVKLFYK